MTKDEASMDANALRGWILEEPVPKPGFTLMDTEGQPFSFREETSDR